MRCDDGETAASAVPAVTVSGPDINAFANEINSLYSKFCVRLFHPAVDTHGDIRHNG